MKNTFIFLYPQEEIFDHEIGRNSYLVQKEWEIENSSRFREALQKAGKKERIKIQAEARKDLKEFFRPVYQKLLNSCIDIRYRSQGFEIVYALLDGEPLSNLINQNKSDKIIYVGMDAKTHRTPRTDQSYPYPSQDYILDQLNNPAHLRVGGFHLWDCVLNLAQRAHERKIDVLVDEDLTELFPACTKQQGFDFSRFPSVNPRTRGNEFFRMFTEARKEPWFFKNYPLIKSKGTKK